MARYLLLLNGRPAGQDCTGYVYFAGGRARAATADSLGKVRTMIRRAERYDKQRGVRIDGYEYSYCLLREPNAFRE